MEVEGLPLFVGKEGQGKPAGTRSYAPRMWEYVLGVPMEAIDRLYRSELAHVFFGIWKILLDTKIYQVKLSLGCEATLMLI